MLLWFQIFKQLFDLHFHYCDPLKFPYFSFRCNPSLSVTNVSRSMLILNYSDWHINTVVQNIGWWLLKICEQISTIREIYALRSHNKTTFWSRFGYRLLINDLIILNNCVKCYCHRSLCSLHVTMTLLLVSGRSEYLKFGSRWNVARKIYRPVPFPATSLNSGAIFRHVYCLKRLPFFSCTNYF